MTSITERISGVGLLIVDPGHIEKGFVTLLELSAKEETAKLPGMRTLPMETIEPGEDHEQAIRRAINTEEIIIDGFTLPEQLAACKLGRYELTPGVVLHSYVLNIPSDNVTIRIGTASNEVGFPHWTRFERVLHTPPGNLDFRPGVKEVVSDYLDMLAQPATYQPRTYRYEQLSSRIPSEAFLQYKSTNQRNTA